MDNVLPELAEALKVDWGLVLTDSVSEETMLQLLAEKILGYIQQGPGTFFQLMYRLDISEKKLNAIMHEENAPLLIARLAYNRQLQKVRSRMESKRNNPPGDPDLQW